MSGLFQDRSEAGRILAGRLRGYAGRGDLLVLALPRGGVPVAFEVAQALAAPLEILVVRKLGLPANEELAMGALASGNVRVLNEEVVRSFEVSDRTIEAVTQKERVELERRERLYRGHAGPLSVRGMTVLLVDDGVATGSTIRAAIAALRQQGPIEIVVAVPVAPPSTCEILRSEADQVVCVATPEPFYAVGQWYRVFDQTTDDEVRALYERSKHL